ncbi:cytochrome c biogenesis protein CcsA [Paenibacillus turpanensis]|uniref:cytochrome c biogenesis protein CcsA n=1 Tax=Paenibacillus turpanensis TaxID=2689078 RepID=UPI00140A73C1|nr:cytochrome c biogenesis protein CcsA [Paenibacillus turpanensis]
MSLTSLSHGSLVVALLLYTLSFFGFVIAVTRAKWKGKDQEKRSKRWSVGSFVLACAGLAAQLLFFFTRWADIGHIPVSNLFEFMTFLGMMIMAAFVVLYAIYRVTLLGVFALPVGVIVLAYASVFPWEAQPLIPSLNSYWLKIHVTTAAAGEAFFAVGFAAGLMYLLRAVDFKATDKASVREQRGVEFVLFVLLIILGFVGSVFAFRGADYHAQFSQQVTVIEQGKEVVKTQVTDYSLPPIFAPYDAKLESMKPFLGMEKPLMEAPYWMKGVNAGRKLNTVTWAVLSALAVYAVLRLLVRKKLAAAISPIMNGIDPEDLDEVGYRSIAIGFPLFTLGALIFAMIWAHIAWSRFWGWDPKEVWALITWLFYSAYLHLRLSRGWQGRRSAWLSVIGFTIVMFTLVGVNLIIAGMHSYAGV